MRTLIPTEFRAAALEGKGKVRNVSQGGLFVGTNAIPEEGDAVELELNAPGGSPIKLSGLVWWTTSQFEEAGSQSGFGLRILDPDDRYLALLASLG